MTSGDLSAYRRLPASQRRAVRRAARRGRRGRLDAALAGPLLAFARRRGRRARRVLVLAVVLILAGAAATAWVSLRSGPGLLLAGAAAALLVGGLAGVVSERQLRRAEEAEALAVHRVPAVPTVSGPPVPAPSQGVARPPAPPDEGAGPPAAGPPSVQPVDGDEARRRLTRILSGGPRAEAESSTGHPWD